MTYKDAVIKDTRHFRQIANNPLSRFHMMNVVHGMTFKELMIKIKQSDRSWSQ